MSRSLRRVLLWLLMLALPLQGLAGVARLHCADGDPAATITPSQAAQAAPGHGIDHDPGHDHPGPGHAGAQATQLGAADGLPGSSDGGTAAAKCSACAACCVALALVPQWSQASAPTPRGVAPLPPEAPATTFLTSGPERPPRPALA